MSYFGVHRLSGRRLAAGFAVVLLAGCSSSGSMSSSESTASPVSTPRLETASPSADKIILADPSPSGPQLLEPVEFAAVIAEPGVRVINVHVPYDGEIAGTDDFVSFDSIQTWSDRPADLATPIAVYCRSGNMSAAASQDLMSLGYTNVVDLDGGMDAWVAAGRQLQRS